jgi:hypothetical protein
MATVPGSVVMVLVVVVAAAIAVAVYVAVRERGQANRGADRLPMPALVPLGEPRELEMAVEESVEQLLVMSTDRPNELYLFGPTARLDEYGATLSQTPPQLARYAAGLQAGANALRSYGELSGRLVLVDDKTAAALKSGMMMKDKAGEILAHVLRDDGKISSVTRLRQVGGIATSVAGLTSALSAMAMQAQLDRIERQLTAISNGIDKANRELLRQWHAQTLGAQEVLREVYGTAMRTGELTGSNWSQIASIALVVRTQIHGDRDRLAASVADLEQLAAAPNVKHRIKELDAKVEAVMGAHAALTESTRTLAQFSALRLWHFTVIGDPTLEEYRLEFEAFVESSSDAIDPLRVRASKALQRFNEHRWTARARHPLLARQLPAASARRLKDLEAISWQPLELRVPSTELEVWVDPSQHPPVDD